MKKISAFIPPYMLRSNTSLLKIQVLLFDRIYTLGGLDFIENAIIPIASGNERCIKALRHIIRPVERSLDPILNTDNEKNIMFSRSEPSFEDLDFRNAFELVWELAKMINPYSDDPWEGEISATIACHPTAWICQKFFHKLITTTKICKNYGAAYVVSEPWEFQEFCQFAPHLISRKSVYFKSIAETRIPSFAEIPWELILKLRKDSHLPFLRNWLDRLSEKDSYNTDENITSRLNSLIEESLWDAVNELNTRPLIKSVQGVISNLPSPISINPFSIAAAIQDTRKAFLTRNALGWLVCIQNIRSKTKKRKKGEHYQESCPLPIMGYVSSKKRKVYHRSWCQLAQKIGRANLQIWRWEMDTEKAGLHPCRFCLAKFREAEQNSYGV